MPKAITELGLVELGQIEIVQQKLDHIFQGLLDIQAFAIFEWIHEAIIPLLTKEMRLSTSFLVSLPKKLEKEHMRTIYYVFKEALKQGQTQWIYRDAEQIKEKHELKYEYRLKLDSFVIWGCLLDGNWKTAQDIFKGYPEECRSPFSLLFFLYGCWLCFVEGEEVAFNHFSSVPKAQFPMISSLWQLISHKKNKDKWLQEAFFYEKNELIWKLVLFKFCMENQLTISKNKIK